MVSGIDVRPVTGAKERKAFLRLPWAIYAQDPLWVPPLLSAMDKLVDPARNPFFEHAEQQLFLAWRGGEPVGRIAATIDRLHAERHGEQVGFWGFFESPNDVGVANALFDAAADHLRGKGMAEMRGPFSPSINGECGLLAEGFDRPPFVLMPHNPAYYPALVEGAGMTRHKDLFAYIIHSEQVGPHRPTIKRLERLATAIRRRHPDLTVRPVDLSRYEDEVLTCGRLFNTVREPNWGFVPMTDAELRALARDMRPIAEPALAIVCELRGKPIGCLLGIPDINPLLRKMNGGLFPFGWLKFLLGRRKLARARIFGAGALPEYRNLGVTPLLITELIHRSQAAGYFTGELSWVAEDNVRSLRVIENAINPECYKTYRIYAREL